MQIRQTTQTHHPTLQSINMLKPMVQQTILYRATMQNSQTNKHTTMDNKQWEQQTSDHNRPLRHISQLCRAEICSNNWCNKLFHNYTTCRTPKPNDTENNNETIKTEAQATTATRNLKQK